MILMYHKVDIVTPTIWWVTPGSLLRHIEQMRGFQFVHLDDYDPLAGNQVVLTFDDAYENVYRHAFPILARERLPFEVFVIGDRIGDWNEFDSSEPMTRFANLDHLQEMASAGGRIQWHTRRHLDLPQITHAELESELTVPAGLKKQFPDSCFRWPAYPFGEHDERVVSFTRRMFSGALSVAKGGLSDRHSLNRIIAGEKSDLNAISKSA